MLSLLFFWAKFYQLNISLYGHMKAELVPQILDSADKYNSV